MTLCRFCGGTDLKVWVGDYHRCNDCLYICTVPEPSAEELSAHYRGYHEDNHQASEEKNRLRSLSYVQELDWLRESIGAGLSGPVYDFGASGGYFLDAIAGHGGVEASRIFGDDLSEGAVEALKRKGYHLSLDRAEAGSMQMVSLRGVLEHVPDFRELLATLLPLVSKDGFFFITATPDAASTVANIYRDSWVQHHYPSHFQHFSSFHVDQLLAEQGFVLLDHVDLYRNSVYRKDTDDAAWIAAANGKSPGAKHAYWGSMMTRLYKRFD